MKASLNNNKIFLKYTDQQASKGHGSDFFNDCPLNALLISS